MSRALDRHLASCSAMLALPLAAWTPLHAAIVYTPASVSLAYLSYSQLNMDFAGGSYTVEPAGSIGGTAYQFGIYVSDEAYLISNASYSTDALYVWTSADGYYADYLTYGTAIGSAGVWYLASPSSTSIASDTFDITFGSGPWPSDSAPAYIGIQILKAGGSYYGWIGLDLDATFDGKAYSGISATISGFAIEGTPGTEIAAGATVSVPEPGSTSLAALATGAAGLLAWRRKRTRLR